MSTLYHADAINLTFVKLKKIKVEGAYGIASLSHTTSVPDQHAIHENKKKENYYGRIRKQ